MKSALVPLPSENPRDDPRDDPREDRLSLTFAALANDTRRAMLARLAEGEATVSELAEPFAMSLPAISKHVKVLERAGLIVQGQRAQYRPCSLEAEPLQEVSSWTDQYRHLWEASFDRMNDYLGQLNSAPEKRKTDRKSAQRKTENNE